MNRIVFACFPASIVLVAACTHPQAVTLTSANAVAPATTEPVAAAPARTVADEAPPAATDVSDPPSTAKDGIVEVAAKDAGPHELTFGELSAALGDSKMDLAISHDETTPAGKGLDSNGYTSAGTVHQAAATEATHGADLLVSGGVTKAAVRGVVHDNAARLRLCYERGLEADPRLAGRVMVSFSIDARGAVSDVESQSDTLPAGVTSCVSEVFGSVTFTAPKAPPAKVVVPVDFNKDS